VCGQLAPTHRDFAFRDSKVHRKLVIGISDISMSQTSMDGLLIGTFRDGLDLCHASPQADGPDPISRFRDFWCSRSLAFQTPDMPMGSRSRHVSSQTCGFDLVEILRLVMSHSFDLRNSDFPMPNIPTLYRFLKHVPNGWTVQMNSRGSRLIASRFPHP
jgi:hypothetical protein